MVDKYVKWLVERDIFEENLDPLIAEIKRQGMEVEQIKYIPFVSGSYDNFGSDDCVMCYASLNLVRQLQRQKPWVPGSFCTLPNFECSKYYAYFGQYLLNQDYVMMPLAEFKRRKDFLLQPYYEGGLSICGDDPEVFVRPSSGFKTFTGQIVRASSFDKDYDYFEDFATPDTLVVVCPPQHIIGEWRFVVCEKKVIAGSRYKPQQQTLTRDFDDIAAQELAACIAEQSWQPDPMWALDICKTKAGFALLEINSFSCSGLYACDVEPIVREASRLAWQEWKEINSGEVK